MLKDVGESEESDKDDNLEQQISQIKTFQQNGK